MRLDPLRITVEGATGASRVKQIDISGNVSEIGETGGVLSIETGMGPSESGVITGGVITINGGDPSLFDVTAGTGVIWDWTDPC